MSTTISLEQLAEKLGKQVWSKGDLKRIYLNDAGFNTKKMWTKCYIRQNDNGDFKVEVTVDCPSQPANWCDSQAEIVRESVYSKIECAVWEIENPEGDYYEHQEQQSAELEAEKDAEHEKRIAEMKEEKARKDEEKRQSEITDEANKIKYWISRLSDPENVGRDFYSSHIWTDFTHIQGFKEPGQPFPKRKIFTLVLKNKEFYEQEHTFEIEADLQWINSKNTRAEYKITSELSEKMHDEIEQLIDAANMRNVEGWYDVLKNFQPKFTENQLLVDELMKIVKQ